MKPRIYADHQQKVWILLKFGFLIKSQIWDLFRHSKAVHMVRAGINLIYIRDFLGHVDCCTTEIYARIDTETKRTAIEKACKDIFPEEKTTDWTADEDLMSFLETLV